MAEIKTKFNPADTGYIIDSNAIAAVKVTDVKVDDSATGLTITNTATKADGTTATYDEGAIFTDTTGVLNYLVIQYNATNPATPAPAVQAVPTPPPAA